MAVERTLILIKPDATERALSGEILARIERRGFTVVGGKLLRVSEQLGKEHYAEHSEKPFFGELVTFITSAPTWALVVEGEGAIATMRKTIGATNPADADPGTIRGDYATSMPNNLIHGSDSPESAQREISLWFSPMSSSELPEYAVRNRARWTTTNAEYSHDHGLRAWQAEEITWGLWGVPEAELNALPDVVGKDVVELGCGTAYFSAWLARRGARPVGVDVTPAQLETARRLQEETGIEFPLLEANAEEVPLPDASFDVAVSEYGASIWCDPYRWIPEAARLLRPGGELVFLRNSTLSMLCAALDGWHETLQRPQRGLNRIDWEDDGTTEFHLPLGELYALLREAGFDVLDIKELYAPVDAEKAEYYHSDPEWGKRWPWEEIWRARRR